MCADRTEELYQLLNAKGIMCMISAASTYDKLPELGDRASAYRAIIHDGPSILETDRPIEAAEAIKQFYSIQSTTPPSADSKRKQYR